MLRTLAIGVLLAGSVEAQEFFTLKGHGGPIMDIAVAPDGDIATASFDNAVGVWASETPKWLDGHEAAVNSVAFLSGAGLVSGGDDFAVRLWSYNGNGIELGRHTAKVMSVDVCQNAGDLIASSSWDSTIGVWDVGTSSTGGINAASNRQVLQGHSSGVNNAVFSRDCSTLYSASSDGTIRVWDVASGSETRVLVKHGFGVNEMILNEAEGWLAYGALDGGTRLINLDTGEQVADFTLDRRPILALAYHAGTHQLAVGDGEGYIMVVDTQARRIIRDFRATQRGPIWALAFSPDGQNIHAGGIEDMMYSWPVATMDEHGPMTGERRSFQQDPDSMDNGERQFMRKCSICHTVTASSARKAGPSLHALFGRRAGTVADYTYSEILTGSEIVWSAETIDALFDVGPDHYIPGTKMPMQRIVKATDRDDLIDYLRQATAPGEN